MGFLSQYGLEDYSLQKFCCFVSAYTTVRGELFPMKLSRASVKKLILLAIALACLLPAMPVAAAESPSRVQALAQLNKSDPQERRRGVRGLAEVGRMDDAPALISALRDPDELVRGIAEEALWAVWSRSGDQKVDELFKRGISEMSEEHLAEAIATFTRIIELKPDFAEGWNKRATVYYLAGEYRRSLADCDEVIKRNPQHFGALSGYGQIYLQLDRLDKALEYFRRALAVNPNLESVQSLIERLEELEVRRRQRTI
jgi:tetratricopeptide (TPR) repeat protein